MPPAYEVLLLNTAVPQIQAAQSGDTYVVPRDIAFSAALTLSAGTANGVPYLDGSKVLTTGSALTFDGTTLGVANGVTGGTALSLTGTYAGSGTVAFINFQRVGGAVAGTLGYDDANTAIRFGTTTNHSTIFLQNNGEAMRLTSTGLGIGESSPATYSVAPNLVVATSGGGGMTVRTNSTYGGVYFADGVTGNEQYRGYVQYNHNFSGVTDALIFGTAGTGNMTLDSSGNLGLGVTPNSGWGSDYKALQIQGASFGQISTDSGVASVGANFYRDSGGTYRFIGNVRATQYQQAAGGHYWFTTGTTSGTAGDPITFTQAMTLDASGNLLVGLTSASNTPASGISINNGSNAAGSSAIAIGHIDGSASGDKYAWFNYNSTTIGSITQNGTTAVAYNTSSDYRLKDNPQPLTNSGAFIDALQPKTWNWKADGSRGVGFIAHEVQAVSPNTVVGEKDAVDADGKPIMQAMEYGSAEFIANIIAELQSLRARVAQLEGN